MKTLLLLSIFVSAIANAAVENYEYSGLVIGKTMVRGAVFDQDLPSHFWNSKKAGERSLVFTQRKSAEDGTLSEITLFKGVGGGHEAIVHRREFPGVGSSYVTTDGSTEYLDCYTQFNESKCLVVTKKLCDELEKMEGIGADAEETAKKCEAWQKIANSNGIKKNEDSKMLPYLARAADVSKYSIKTIQIATGDLVKSITACNEMEKIGSSTMVNDYIEGMARAGRNVRTMWTHREELVEIIKKRTTTAPDKEITLPAPREGKQ